MISNLTITGNGQTVHFGLLDDAQCVRSGSAVGGGGWQVTDRPRGKTATEWVDVGHYQLTMNLVLDSFTGQPTPTSLEGVIKQVEAWEAPANGSNPPLPPRLRVHGPVPHNELEWIVYQLVWGPAYRAKPGGWRYWQQLSVTLWEYCPPSISVANAQSPAAKAATPGSSTRTYTVKRGDTLASIAARVLGDARKWTLIAALNGIRDPKSIKVGQVLKLPATPSK